MRQELEQGHPGVFTADGPRGPLYVAKPGAVVLARWAGHKICCFHIAVERAWILKSWDRMMIPKPFSRAAGYGSSAIEVPPYATDQDLAALHQQVAELTAAESERRQVEGVLRRSEEYFRPRT